MLPGHYAALVTQVKRDEAQIIVDGRNAKIPFDLAFWAYPPRDENGVRPPPLRDLRHAITAGDIVMVQPPSDTPDLIRDGLPRRRMISRYPNDLWSRGNRCT